MAGRFSIATAVILCLSAIMINAGPVRLSSQCPRPCGNECDFLPRHGRSCREVNGKLALTCDPGFEYPRDGGKENCFPVSWGCYVPNKDQPQFIRCKRELVIVEEIMSSSSTAM